MTRAQMCLAGASLDVYRLHGTAQAVAPAPVLLSSCSVPRDAIPAPELQRCAACAPAAVWY